MMIDHQHRNIKQAEKAQDVELRGAGVGECGELVLYFADGSELRIKGAAVRVAYMAPKSKDGDPSRAEIRERAAEVRGQRAIRSMQQRAVGRNDGPWEVPVVQECRPERQRESEEGERGGVG